MSKVWLSCGLAVLVACGGSGTGAPDPTADPDAGVVAQPDAGDPIPLTGIDLPQAVGDAMWANPIAQAQIPLHVAIEGDATEVVVELDGVEFAATDTDSNGSWTANLPISGLDDGDYTVTATARGAADTELETTALLHLGRTGKQLTSIALDGNAGTPRLHRVGDELWLTWTDGLATRSAWMRKLDGAGNWASDRVRLVGGEDQDILYARTAVGASSIAVLYQQPGGPYENYITVVDHSGSELLAPIPLDPSDQYGSFGGSVSYDGSGYVVVWRVNNGGGVSHIRWLRINESDRAITGPVIVAEAGNEDPHGGFLPITWITVEATGGRSLVSFVRDWYDPVLELSIPKCQVAVVDAAGDVVATQFAAIGSGFHFHYECKLFRDARGPILIWSSDDLTSAQTTPPTGFYAARASADGTLSASRGNGDLIVAEPMHRTEPFLRTAGNTLQLNWLDERSHADPLTGQIELFSAPLDGTMAAVEQVKIAHARFISGTSQLQGADAGSNTVLVWIDDRHGSGIANPVPEIFFETVWR